MPVYEFRCRRCSRRFEELVGSHVGLEPGDVTCPGCGAPEPERLLTSEYAPQARRMTANQKRRLEDARGTDRGGAMERFRRQRAAERRGGGAMADAASRRERLVEVYRQASSCERCPLHETRNKVVFGAGDADAELMFVGEAPGAEEDRQGLPFVGRAGKFLGELLEGIGLSRDQVFITNVLKSRPPGNRDPQPEEIESCRPWLDQQVELIEPRVIATLGNFATKLLTANQTGITKVHGTPQQHVIGGRSLYVLPLFHPAAGLRTPRVAEQLRADFRGIPGLLEQPPPEPPPGITAAGGEGEREPARDADQLDIFG